MRCTNDHVSQSIPLVVLGELLQMLSTRVTWTNAAASVTLPMCLPAL